MGIHRFLQSSCCFLNTNCDNATTNSNSENARSRMVASLRGSVGMGTKEVSQVLGAFGLLDFTMLRPVLAWRAFWNLWTVYIFNFPNFFSGRGNWNRGYWIRGYGGLPVCGGLAKTPKIKKLISRYFKECVCNITERISVPGTRHTDRKPLSSGITADKICTML